MAKIAAILSMRVCHIISYSADSEYTRNLGLGLAGKGIEQLWVTLFSSGAERPGWTLEAPNIDYCCLGVKGRGGFPLAALRLAKLLRERGIELIQTHLYEASLVGLIAAKLARVRVKVLTRHHLDQAHQIGKRLPLFVDKWEAGNADHIVVLGAAVKRFMVEAEGVPEAKVNVVHQGFDFDRFSATEAERERVRGEFGFTDEDIVIGTFGNFFPTKGQRFVLEAASRLVERHQGIKLFFVGDGGDKGAVEERASELGLAGRVVYAGFRKDVPACMKACDMVVHPSLSEAFCQVLVETMSVGTPLISTDVGGAREVIEDGRTATLVPPEDAEAIVEAVDRIISDPVAAASAAERAQRSVRERFTIERMVNLQFELYRKWLGH